MFSAFQNAYSEICGWNFGIPISDRFATQTTHWTQTPLNFFQMPHCTVRERKGRETHLCRQCRTKGKRDALRIGGDIVLWGKCQHRMKGKGVSICVGEGGGGPTVRLNEWGRRGVWGKLWHYCSRVWGWLWRSYGGAAKEVRKRGVVGWGNMENKLGWGC